MLYLALCLSLDYVTHQLYDIYMDLSELYLMLLRCPQSIIIYSGNLLAYLLISSLALFLTMPLEEVCHS